MFISVAGNIGSGKTTLTKLLAKHFNWDPLYVDEDVNPYLNDFYKDMQRWSFNLQVYFMATRIHKIQEYLKTGKNFIQDRSIYEDAYIFAPNLQSMGLMTSRDSETYFKLFKLSEGLIEPPDILIYLHGTTDVLISQIKERGRSYEADLIEDYLERLNIRYEDWSENYEDSPIIKINVDENNFNTNKDDLKLIVNKINEVKASLNKK